MYLQLFASFNMVVLVFSPLRNRFTVISSGLIPSRLFSSSQCFITLISVFSGLCVFVIV